MPMALLGITMEGKRGSALRRWKEQRRSSHAICFTALAFVWVMTCFLMKGPGLPLERPTAAANQGTAHLRDFFVSVSSSDIGGNSGLGSVRREVQQEVNWVRLKSSQDGHTEFSKSKKGSADENEESLKAKEVGKGDNVDGAIWGANSSNMKEGQGQSQLGKVLAWEKVQAKNASVMTDGSIRKATGSCAEVEEMGSAAVGDTRSASLKLRKMIRSYFAEHGADRLRQLPSDLFCERSFVLGKAQEDGLGNNMYKLLTAAGLGVILNRSLIIAEGGATNPGYLGRSKSPVRLPWGHYLSYSDQAFSMREVKQLWADHNCSGQYNRPLVLKRDDFDTPVVSTSLCEDWSQWTYPILWFKGTQDTVALQFLLKNQHPNLRSAASMVLGDPSQPDSRPNTFGELMMAVVQPKLEVREAVEWALGRRQNSSNGAPSESPDIALHLRMRHSSSRSGPEAATSCILRILDELPSVITHRKPRIVVVSDTPSVLAFMKKGSLDGTAEIISFDYEEFLSSSSRSSEFSLRSDAFLPPSKRKRDWGPLPRWVAVVDFYLAARARHAVVTGAHHRVGTTYAQLVASLAAAYTLEENEDGEQLQQPAKFYSSFQESLLVQGLTSQGGWGHSWRPFGGKLSCPNQPTQCAITPLLPYAWWDAPLQSPIHRDRVKMRRWGITVESNGEVTDTSVQRFCRKGVNSTSESLLLALPKATS